jgi:hypothetical protein
MTDAESGCWAQRMEAASEAKKQAAVTVCAVPLRLPHNRLKLLAILLILKVSVAAFELPVINRMHPPKYEV